jgi:hypothetical protein
MDGETEAILVGIIEGFAVVLGDPEGEADGDGDGAGESDGKLLSSTVGM